MRFDHVGIKNCPSAHVGMHCPRGKLLDEPSLWKSGARRTDRASVDRPGLFRGPTTFCLFEIQGPLPYYVH